MKSGRMGGNKPPISLPPLRLSSWFHVALVGKVETPLPERTGLVGQCKE